MPAALFELRSDERRRVAGSPLPSSAQGAAAPAGPRPPAGLCCCNELRQWRRGCWCSGSAASGTLGMRCWVALKAAASRASAAARLELAPAACVSAAGVAGPAVAAAATAGADGRGGSRGAAAAAGGAGAGADGRGGSWGAAAAAGGAGVDGRGGSWGAAAAAGGAGADGRGRSWGAPVGKSAGCCSKPNSRERGSCRLVGPSRRAAAEPPAAAAGALWGESPPGFTLISARTLRLLPDVLGCGRE